MEHSFLFVTSRAATLPAAADTAGGRILGILARLPPGPKRDLADFAGTSRAGVGRPD